MGSSGSKRVSTRRINNDACVRIDHQHDGQQVDDIPGARCS
jgi:hypothetical protein